MVTYIDELMREKVLIEHETVHAALRGKFVKRDGGRWFDFVVTLNDQRVIGTQPGNQVDLRQLLHEGIRQIVAGQGVKIA